MAPLPHIKRLCRSSYMECVLTALVFLFLFGDQIPRTAFALDNVVPEIVVSRTTQSGPDAADSLLIEPDPPSILEEEDFIAPVKPPNVPDDPCLQPVYKDWHELSKDAGKDRQKDRFIQFRIILDRSNFTLSFEGIRRDGSVKTFYQSTCGLGNVDTPTPSGEFIINHVYCYPDVLYFGTSGERISSLYKGFFAPLLFCDEEGKCRRFRDLGLHGFKAPTNRRRPSTEDETCGPVSGGCIRIPDPCKFKSELIRTVGIGPLKKNDRGTYHWLDRPVLVIIQDYPGSDDQITIGSLLELGVNSLRRSLEGVFGP